MAIDFEALRKKLGQLSGNNSKRRVFWRPEEGKEYAIRIIAFPDNDGNPFKERYFYYNIGNNPGLLSPYQFGKPDPIQELINKLRDEGSKESYELAKKLYPKMRSYAAVIVRGEENEGVRLWAFGKQVYQNLLNVMLDPDYGDITDIKEGHDIKVFCSKAPGMKWATTEVRPRPKSTALGSRDQAKQWLSTIPNLDDFFQLESYEKLENIINNWLNEGDTEVDNATEHRSANKTPTKSKATDTGKTFNKIDDAFADLEDFDL
tara:strand:- start:772 stop:1557 length:786 start_codon:yes stop_codon:yes gene_type:complete